LNAWLIFPRPQPSPKRPWMSKALYERWRCITGFSLIETSSTLFLTRSLQKTGVIDYRAAAILDDLRALRRFMPAIVKLRAKTP
jgi:hypothetical protein